MEKYFSADIKNWKIYAIIRHDVDRYPSRALKMARIENSLNIRSTYYFRTRTHVFRKDILDEINSLNHEIGYHYENLADSNGRYEDAIKKFVIDLEKFREWGIFPKTISMHGSPLSSYDNRDLWMHYNYKDYGIIGEAYEIDSDKIYYFSDTGMNFSNSKGNVRDKPKNIGKQVSNISTITTLIRFLNVNDNPICISMHPDKWSLTKLGELITRVENMLKNFIKYLVVKIRNN
tara:strand:+ start:1835 stop:2533 length:699 start_codon:yes stop_codon:yes gene_type:complete